MSKEKYYIRIKKTLVEVTESQYLAYYRSKRRMRYYEHDIKIEPPIRDDEGNIIGYAPRKEDSLERILGIGIEFADNREDVEDMIIKKVMLEKLHKGLKMLSDKERTLIEALFFTNDGKGMTERDYAEKSGIPYQTVHSRKVKILTVLKKILKN